jgi:ABC-type branched-subunit amino acid transport system ATPase component
MTASGEGPKPKELPRRLDDGAMASGVSCRNLSKSFHGSPAVTDLTIDFPPFRTVAIIGPNGAGKTTLLNLITGFTRPDAGEISFMGCDLTRLSRHEIAQLGISRTFQELRLITQLSVIENVVLAGEKPTSERLLTAVLGIGNDEDTQNYETAHRILDEVGLGQEAYQSASELSYGQRKLLTLACCIATEPRVFLFDEPVSGLHPDTTDKVVKVLQRLSKAERTIIFVEHDIMAVRQLAQHLIVMDHGRVIAEGVPNEVLEQDKILKAYVA